MTEVECHVCAHRFEGHRVGEGVVDLRTGEGYKRVVGGRVEVPEVWVCVRFYSLHR